MAEIDRSKAVSNDVCAHMYGGCHYHRTSDDSKRAPVLGDLVVEGVTVPNQVLGWQRPDSGNYSIKCCRCDSTVAVKAGGDPAPDSFGEHWERGDSFNPNPMPRPAMEPAEDPAPVAPAPVEG